jgi:hypothetical protein
MRFPYPGDDVPPETIVINLETGMDETFHARVTSIRPAASSHLGASSSETNLTSQSFQKSATTIWPM